MYNEQILAGGSNVAPLHLDFESFIIPLWETTFPTRPSQTDDIYNKNKVDKYNKARNKWNNATIKAFWNTIKSWGVATDKTT